MFILNAIGEIVGPFETANEAASFITDNKLDTSPSIKMLTPPSVMATRIHVRNLRHKQSNLKSGARRRNVSNR